MTEADYDSVPKSMVLHRSEIPKDLKSLESDIRSLMYPFTAMKVKDSGKAKIKEILRTTKNFGVKNLFMLSSKGKNNLLKIAGLPHGPTFTFKIATFSLGRDLQRLLPRNKNARPDQLGAPLAVVKGFGGDGKTSRMLNALFSNLFPRPGGLGKPTAASIKRTVLIYKDSKKGTIEIRNYFVKRTYTGIDRNIKKMVNSNRLPDFSKMDDVADLFVKNHFILSDSDIDALPNSKVELEEKLLGERKRQQVNIRLYVG